MRTSVKMPHVQVMLDREIAGDCDFSFLHDLPMGYELEQVVGACAAVNNHMADKKQHAANKQQNLAAFRNNLAKEKHEKLAWRVTSLDAREEDLAAFDDERDFLSTSFLPAVGGSGELSCAQKHCAAHAVRHEWLCIRRGRSV